MSPFVSTHRCSGVGSGVVAGGASTADHKPRPSTTMLVLLLGVAATLHPLGGPYGALPCVGAPPPPHRGS